METLKKNGFAISLGILGIGALALLYFLVLGKIWGDLATTKGDLNKIQGEYRRYSDKNKTQYPPSPQVKEMMEQARGSWSTALGNGELFYDTKKQSFDQIDFAGGDKDPSGFKTFYQTEVEQLRKDFQDKFLKKEEAPTPSGTPGAEEAAPVDEEEGEKLPLVDLYPQFNQAEDVQRAMKELWIIREVFKVAAELQLAGLHRISFPERFQAESRGPRSPRRTREKAKEAPKEYEYDWIGSRVSILMPFLKIEPFLAKICESQRVPFLLQALRVGRQQESILKDEVAVKVYTEANQMKSESPEDIVAEPGVMVVFEFSSLNWKGKAKPTEETSKEDTDSRETRR